MQCFHTPQSLRASSSILEEHYFAKGFEVLP